MVEKKKEESNRHKTSYSKTKEIMGCNQSTYPTGVPAFEETRYQITFLLEHEIIGEFGEKIITNPLNSSSDSYKKEMKQNVYMKSIHSSVAKYVQSYGMKVGDIIETISVEGPDGFEHEVISLDDTTKSLLNNERPITLTCCRKIYNKKYLEYWKRQCSGGRLNLNQGCCITNNDIVAIGEVLKTNNTLKMLNLDRNLLSDVQNIGEALKTNSTLTWLDLNVNYITDVQSIGEGLKRNSTLTYLELGSNNITDVSSIGEALKTNNTLKTLYLYNNNITDNSGIQIIIDALKINNTLTEL